MHHKLKKLLYLLGVFIFAFSIVYGIKWWQFKTNETDNYNDNAVDLATKSAIKANSVPLLARLNTEYAKTASYAVKSVVSIDTRGAISRTTTLPGYRSGAETYRVRGIGSGVIVSHQGHILTNNHVIEGKQEIRVTLHDGRNFPARLIGEDKVMDIAVLKIDVDDDLPPLAFGNSDQVKVGEIVFALGNPFGLGETVSHGIVSAKQRNFGDLQSDLIQTDAALNLGSSGGPLVNIYGEIIGLNAAIYSNSKNSTKFQGISFSIPINLVKEVFEQICRYGKPIRGYIGVAFTQPTAQICHLLNYNSTQGVVVNDVHSDSPAAKVGLRPGDIILALNDTEVNSPLELLKDIQHTPIGTTITLDLWRQGENLTLNIPVEEASVLKEPEDSNKELSKLSQLGLKMRNLTLDELAAGATGVLVREVSESSKAAEIFRSGDLILAVDNNPIRNLDQFKEALKQGMVTVTAKRRNLTFNVRVELPTVSSSPVSPSSYSLPPTPSEEFLTH